MRSSACGKLLAKFSEQREEARLAGLQLAADIRSGATQLPVTALCRQLIQDPQALQRILAIRGLDSLGCKSDTVAAMGAQRRGELELVCRTLIVGLLQKVKAGRETDLQGTLTLAVGEEAAQRYVLCGKSIAAAKDPLDHPVVKQLAESYRTAIQLGKRGEGLQFLSIVLGAISDMKGVTQAGAEARFTSLVPLWEGTVVKVIVGASRKYRLAKVVSREADTEDGCTAPGGNFLVQFYPEAPGRANAEKDADDLGGVDDEELEPETLVVSETLLVSRKRLIAAMDVRPDHHAMAKASAHSKTAAFPGATC